MPFSTVTAVTGGVASAPAAAGVPAAAAVAFLPPAAPRCGGPTRRPAAAPRHACGRRRRGAACGDRQRRQPPKAMAMGPPHPGAAGESPPPPPSAATPPPTAATAAVAGVPAATAAVAGVPAATAAVAGVPAAAAPADTPALPLPPAPLPRGTSPPPPVPHPSPPAGVSFRVAASAADVAAARALRLAVFVDEMGIDADAELDEHDVLGSPTTVHVLAVRTAAAAGGNGNGHGRHRSGRDETVVGACRVRAAAGTIIKVERVVVAAAARRGGIAGAMVAYAAGQVGVDARLPAGSAVALHAMAHRAGLYSRLGWVVVSGVFDEEGIPHVRMVHWGGDWSAGTPNLLAPPPPPRAGAAADATPRAAAVVATSSHVCLAVADVEVSSAYFGLWGFVEDRRFLTGGRRAVWLRTGWPALGGEVLELVEEPPAATGGRRSPPPPGTGVRHLCLDVTRLCTDLPEYLAGVAARSELTYGRRLDVVTSPVQVLMGDLVAQVAVVRHGGVEIELLRRQAVLPPGKAPAPDW